MSLRLETRALLAVAAVFAGGPVVASAQSPPAQHDPQHAEIDDPKVARRLKTRLARPQPLQVAQADMVLRQPAAAEDVTVIKRQPEEAAAPAARVRERRVPHAKLGFRRFSFVRPGSIDPPSTAAADQDFNNLLLDLYPLSTYVRLGLTTQYGWESGTWRSSGDYLIAQSAALGVQFPGHRVTPFVDAFAGAGYMRRRQFEISMPTAYWHMGIDAGTEVFLAKHLLVSVAVGYLRAVNGFLKQDQLETMYSNAWSFKLAVGL